MKLMEIEPNVLVNLDLIESASLKMRSGKQVLVISIGGKERIISTNPIGLFQKLVQMSMEEKRQQQYVSM